MKKELFSLVSVGLCSIMLLCGFEMPPNVEEPPPQPVYTQEELSKETFEANGRILETSNSVPPFEINIPVRVVDPQGNPVQNAGIAASYTYNNYGYTMRMRPELNSFERPILTNYEGRAVIPYKGNFSQFSLFAVGPDALAEHWGKFIKNDSYPSCSARLDVDFPVSGPIDEITIILPESGQSGFSDFSYTVSLAGRKKQTDYLVYIQRIPTEIVRHIPEDPSPLPCERLVGINGNITFPNLEAGKWKVEIFDCKNRYDENGLGCPIASAYFTLDRKNPHRKAIFLLPEK